MKKYIALGAVLLFVFLLIPPAASAQEREGASSGFEGYTLVAESGDYRLYYCEPRFSILLQNKETGTCLESAVSDEKDDGANNKSWTGYMKSGIVLYAIIGTTNTYQVDMLTCKNNIKTSYTKNGLSAAIEFPEYGFALTVEVALEGGDLIVRVPDSSIKEEKKDNYISTVSLFPFFGYSYLDDKEGYMLIPDGNGALIRLNDKEGKYSTGFSRLIYGKDYGFEQTVAVATSELGKSFNFLVEPNEVIAPVFGLAHTDDRQGYLAVVESGDERCSIEAHPNGAMIAYNRCFAKFLLRDIFTQPLNNSNSGTVQSVEAERTHMDLQLRYRLLSGDDANYSGMAASYRDYLLGNGEVALKDTGYNTRVDFLGTDREEFILGTAAVTMTTVENIREMYGRLRSAGVGHVLTVYKGWQSGGFYSLPISGYRADRHIGGTAALTNLIKEAGAEGYKIYLYDQTLRANSATNATTFNAMKMVNKRTYKYESRDEVYRLFYMLMPAAAGNTLRKFTESYINKGVNTLAIDGMSNQLFSYSSRGGYYTRTDTRNAFVNAVASISEKCNLVLEEPFAYMWKYADAFLDMPLASSGYLYADEDVPFLSMVLKGVIPIYSEYINFKANKTESFLKMVESGIYPSFYLTYENSSKLIYTNSNYLYSTEFASYEKTVSQYDAEFSALAKKTEGAFIRRHEKLENGLVKVSYSNGVKIYVNYSGAALKADGIIVKALSYEAGE
jgi:hypothetical protein